MMFQAWSLKAAFITVVKLKEKDFDIKIVHSLFVVCNPRCRVCLVLPIKLLYAPWNSLTLLSSLSAVHGHHFPWGHMFPCLMGAFRECSHSSVHPWFFAILWSDKRGSCIQFNELSNTHVHAHTWCLTMSWCGGKSKVYSFPSNSLYL